MQEHIINIRNHERHIRVEKVPYWNIIIMGLGGNGGYILRHVAQMMRIFNQQGMIVVADGDMVEEKICETSFFFRKTWEEKKRKFSRNGTAHTTTSTW